MHTNGPKEDPLVDLGYESRDVNPKGIGKAAFVFFLFTFLSFAVVLVWFWLIGPGQARKNTAAGFPRVMPDKPNPLLQNSVSTKVDMMAVRQEETKRLEGTGYVDQAKGIVHIPIDQAIDLVASGQVPVQTGNSVPATNKGSTAAQPGETAARSAVPNPPGNGQ